MTRRKRNKWKPDPHRPLSQAQIDVLTRQTNQWLWRNMGKDYPRAYAGYRHREVELNENSAQAADRWDRQVEDRWAEEGETLLDAGFDIEFVADYLDAKADMSYEEPEPLQNPCSSCNLAEIAYKKVGYSKHKSRTAVNLCKRCGRYFRRKGEFPSERLNERQRAALGLS